MTELKLYYATNRNHIGNDRWHPNSYGTKFSDDGIENLRFGVVTVTAENGKIDEYLDAQIENCGVGDGESLGSYLSGCVKTATIDAYHDLSQSQR